MSKRATIEDLRRPGTKSGFYGVRKIGGQPSRGKSPVYFQAEHATSKKVRANGRWHGPRRDTAEAAAQDYIDYVNGNGNALAPIPARLKSAGHTARRNPMSDPEVQAALGILRDAKGQREGRQGYVYLIVEDNPGGGLTYGKVGYSTNPEARVAELQTGNPRLLRLLYSKPGTLSDEAAIHARHIKHNVLQEWFHVTKELIFEWDAEHAATKGASA